MQQTAGVDRLGRLVGIDSLDRNLRAEDRQVAANVDRLDGWLSDDDDGSVPTGGADEMRVLAGGNVTVHHHPKPEPTSEPKEEPTEATPKSPGLIRTILPYVLAAVIGGAIPGAILLQPLIAKWFETPAAQPDAQPDMSTSIGIGGGEPTLTW